ncbi:hypothetical protein D9M73_158790 [compost metagenome]
MQYLVMQQVVQQRMGHGIGSRRQEHGSALNTVRRLYGDTADEDRQRQSTLIDTLDQQLLAALPGGHQHKQRETRDHRECTALNDFRHVGGEVQTIDQHEAEQYRNREDWWPLPQQQHHRRHQDGGHQHGTGDRNPVGCRQSARGPEADDQQHHTHHQRPVHCTNVDLPLLVA